MGSLLFSGCGNGDLKSKYDENEKTLFALSTKITSMDPGKGGDVTSAKCMGRIYEGLLQYHYLERPYKLVPLLAEEMPQVSDDGLIYTFKIRQGIYFQDDACFPGGKGRELVADDFVYSFKRVLDAKRASSGVWAFDRVKGVEPFKKASRTSAKTDFELPVEGLRVLDRYTLQIELSEPYPQFLNVLAMHYAYAFPHEADDMYGDEIDYHPVGTGPYLLADWVRNYRIEFVRNPKWAETGRVETYPATGTEDQRARGLLEDAGKSVPFIDRLVYYLIEEQSTAWMMFLAGQMDLSGISQENWDSVMTVGQKLSDVYATRKIQLHSSPTLQVGYIGFNMDDAVVGRSRDPEQDVRNRKLRQAMSCAYDFNIINSFYNSRMFPSTDAVPTQLSGHIDEPAVYGYDLERAKRLLAEAGYPNGIDPETGRRLQLSLEVSGSNQSTRSLMQIYADMFDKINIDVVASFNAGPAFFDKLDKRQVQLFLLGWVGDYPDAENFLQLFYSKNESPGPNHTNYRNPEFDRVYEQARVMPDNPERTALYEELNRIVIEDCPWIFLYQGMDFALTYDWVKNYEPHDFPYGMDIYRDIDLEQRAKWAREFGNKPMDMSAGK